MLNYILEFMEVAMRFFYKYLLVIILLLYSNYAPAQIKPVQTETFPTQNHSRIKTKQYTKFYNIAFKIKIDGKIIATPQAIAKAGDKVTISSVAKIPYKINFKMLDYTMFNSKDVFGTFAPDNTPSQMLVEAELLLKDKRLTETGTWKIVSAPKLLTMIDGDSTTSKVNVTHTQMDSPVLEGILQNVTFEVNITNTPLDHIDLSEAKHRGDNGNCKQNKKPDDSNIFKFDGTTPPAPGDGGSNDDNCCTDGCLTCCGVSAYCGDSLNCPGGGCCT